MKGSCQKHSRSGLGEERMKTQLFFENATLLFREWGIVPLMYGSLGLEYITGENLNADDIDILIPEVFLQSKWSVFQAVLKKWDYILIDEREHTFEKDGISYSYASIEELQTFAGIPVCEIAQYTCDHVRFRLLSLEQYRNVYIASAKDGYRIDVRQKKDSDKLAIIERYLPQQERRFPV